MRKMIFLVLVPIWIFLNPIGLKSQTITDSLQISLLTASQGEDTYAAFGHSAIRVFNPSKNMNYVFNYGTFNFATPNFYFKFTTGRLLYSLSIADCERFLYSYYTWGQAIYEQKLLLSAAENKRLFELLMENYKEENRYYRYSFFYDNCATRIRDIVEEAVDGKIVYDQSLLTKKQTFRQLIVPAMRNTPWMHFGENFLLGTGTDSVATYAQHMFLPVYLKDFFAGAKIVSGNSVRPLTEKPVELFPATLVFEKPNPLFTPVSIFSVLLLVIVTLTWFQYKYNWNLSWLDKTLFIITGLMGLLMAFLWIFSLHRELENNFNIIWASPVNFIIAILLFIKPSYKWLKYIILTYAASVALFIPLSFFLTQTIPEAAYLICGIMLVRSWMVCRKLKLLK